MLDTIDHLDQIGELRLTNPLTTSVNSPGLSIFHTCPAPSITRSSAPGIDRASSLAAGRLA